MPTGPSYGTLDTRDTLQALRISNGTVVQYGEDDVWTAVNAAFVAQNIIMRESLSTFCSFGGMRLTRYGNPMAKVMEELDEYGQAQGQKGRGGSEVGFPLRRFGAALQWSRDYFTMTRAADFAGEVTQILEADARRITSEIKRSIYGATNYTFYDVMTDNAALPVRRLVNGDGNPLPIGPNGEEFNANTHSHYLARVSTFAQTDLDGLILHVTEHFKDGKVYVAIDQSVETAVRAFADFIPLPYEGTEFSSNVTRDVSGRRITAFNSFNRMIGTFKGAEVWVKPWAITNYIVAWVEGPSVEKPLYIRVPAVLGSDGSIGAELPSILNGGSTTEPGMGDLRLVYQDEDYPLRSNQYERRFGIGIKNRVSMAVLYIGGTSYVTPTIS